VLAARFWPTRDPEVIEHEHDLDHDHHHLADAALVDGRWRHVHHYRIDDLHHRWPA
jgi:hypothetical protein